MLCVANNFLWRSFACLASIGSTDFTIDAILVVATKRNIGILGLDRGGVETYQITLGGDHTETATVGERTGPGFSAEDIVPAVERLVAAYLDLRDDPKETFLQTYRRVGMVPFKQALYEPREAAHAA